MAPTISEASRIAARLGEWEANGYYLIYFCIFATVGGMVVSFIFEKVIKPGADGANYFAIFRFFSNIADFGSDILLTIAFYLIYDEIGDDFFVFFILSFIFTCVPYFFSCIVGLYFIEKWRNNVDGLMISYLKKYDVFLICMTIIAGFYSGVELASSRLFYLKMFNLHTRRKDQVILKNYRFVNTILLENVPQISLQTYYLASSTSGSNFTPLVLISMTFTILSMLVSFFSQISRVFQARGKRDKEFLNIENTIMRLTIKCDDLQTHHAFSREKIEICLQDVLDINEDLADLHHRKDVSLSIEVLNIKELTKTKHSLIAIVEFKVLTQDHSNANDSLKSKILDNFKNIGVSRHPNNTEMINVS